MIRKLWLNSGLNIAVQVICRGAFYNLQLLNISITTISIIVHPMVYYISVQNTENAEKQNPDKTVLRKEYIHHGKGNHF